MYLLVYYYHWSSSSSVLSTMHAIIPQGNPVSLGLIAGVSLHRLTPSPLLPNFLSPHVLAHFFAHLFDLHLKKETAASRLKLSLYSCSILRANGNFVFWSLSFKRPFWSACRNLHPSLQRSRSTVRKETCLGLISACCISHFTVHFSSDFLNFGISCRSHHFSCAPIFQGHPEAFFLFSFINCYRRICLPLECGRVRHGICATSEWCFWRLNFSLPLRSRHMHRFYQNVFPWRPFCLVHLLFCTFVTSSPKWNNHDIYVLINFS